MKPADVHFQLNRIQYVDFHKRDFAVAFADLRAELGRQGIVVDDGQGQMQGMLLDVDAAQSAMQDDPEIRRLLSGLYAPPIRRKTQTLPRVEDILPPPFEWCEIPAGKVTLEKGGYLEEPTTFDVPAFAIAKYPITNAQFAKFVEAGGYGERRWWTDAGWHQKEWDNWTEPRFWRKKEWNGVEYPVVGVSWYEAVAFSQWLNEAAGAHSRAPLQITLPTEQQWQRAAQGDDGRAFPWGDEFDKAKCNTSKSNIEQTTPVTKYPQGASPYGVMDMSGNVWEWCLTAYKTGATALDGADRRCLRGGSWGFNTVNARASSRNYFNPFIRTSYYGFRVGVSSPI